MNKEMVKQKVRNAMTFFGVLALSTLLSSAERYLHRSVPKYNRFQELARLLKQENAAFKVDA